jgi:hypothetical protein
MQATLLSIGAVPVLKKAGIPGLLTEDGSRVLVEIVTDAS